MKQSLKQIMNSQIILIPAIFLAACSSPFNSNKSTEYQIPWRSENGKYDLQNIAISSLSDPDSLNSPLVRLFVTPAEENGNLAAPPAIGRFMTSKDGVRVPLDFVSLQGATIHAHFERMNQFDRAAGVDRELTWPLKISVETEMLSKTEKTNNAFYDGVRNAIIILPYYDGAAEGLPLSLNGGVLAHEHFHAIYDKLVMKRLDLAGLKVDRKLSELAASLPPEISKLEIPAEAKPADAEAEVYSVDYNKFILRATNEGLADYWSWLQLGDNDFVGRSIGNLRECRRLDKPFTSLPDRENLKYQVFHEPQTKQSKEEMRAWMYYQVGAQYARFLRELTISLHGEKPSLAERLEMAQALIATLREFSQLVIKDYKLKDIELHAITNMFLKNLPSSRLNKQTCQLLSEFKRSTADLPEGCSSIGISTEDVTKKVNKRAEKAPLEFRLCE